MEMSFRFLPTGIFEIPLLISVGIPLVGIFRPKFAAPYLTNRFFSLIREFGKGIKSGESHCYWLARFYWKMSFHFLRVFALISGVLSLICQVSHNLRSGASPFFWGGGGGAAVHRAINQFS